MIRIIIIFTLIFLLGCGKTQPINFTDTTQLSLDNFIIIPYNTWEEYWLIKANILRDIDCRKISWEDVREIDYEHDRDIDIWVHYKDKDIIYLNCINEE